LPAVQHGKAIIATVKIVANRSSLKARLFWQKRKGGKRLQVGSVVKTPLSKGLRSFTVKLNERGLGPLKRLKTLKLTLVVTVIPPQGAIAQANKRVTLKL